MASGGSELVSPSINAALVRPVSKEGVISGKASGIIVQVLNEFYLLTNWHVATGRRWMTAKDEADWNAKNPDKIAWVSKTACYETYALDVSIPLSGKLLRLARIDMNDPHETDEKLTQSYAWDNPLEDARSGVMMPDRDVVCIHLGSHANQWSNIVSTIAGQRLQLGYQWTEIGLDHEPKISDPVFVVGYPRDIGNDDTDPPVWTSGTIATDPAREWKGARFLIDSRTRDGQSGSAVIAYATAAGGLPSRHQVLGIYSGRIDEKADIGSVWYLDDIIESLCTGSKRPRARRLSSTVDPDDYILKDGVWED
jgi:hypothetical protein